MIHTLPLKLENMSFRSHDVIGIHELNGSIVYVRGALEDTLQETPDNKTASPNLVIADCFSPDFAVHTQIHVSHLKGVFYAKTHAASYVEDEKLFLNTFKTTSKTLSKIFGGDGDAFKMLFEITDSDILEVSPFPDPEEYVPPDQKTYCFGDYALRMASDWKLECRSIRTDAVLWVLRLTSYLYTELEVRNDVLYFGTAGKGGHLYGISLDNGHVIFDWNTGGTTKIVWKDDCIIITDRKGNLVLVNSTNGTEIKRFRFHKMVASIDYPFLVRGNRIYTVLRDKKDCFALYATCVEI